MSGEGDDWWNSIPNPARWLILGALLTGTGSGAINFNKDTSDRFKAADFRREIAVRDARITALEGEVRTLRVSHQRHLEHSAKYTEKIDHIESMIGP